MTPKRSPRANKGVMFGEALDAVPAEVAEGIYLPHTRYRGSMTYGEYKLVMDIRITDRKLVCEALSITSISGGPPVTAASMRTIPLAALVQRSFEGLGFPYRLVGGDRVDVSTSSMIEERSAREARSVVLPRVVQAYREALADPATRSSPTQAVADRLHYARGYVSRLLSEARRMDPPLLGAARPGAAGELRSE